MKTRTDVEVVCRARVKITAKIVVIYLLLDVICTVIANEENKESVSNSCSEWCKNGRCVDQQCICDPCWKGAKCDHFVDLHLPIFSQKHTQVYLNRVTLEASKPIFQVKAIDKDAEIECAKNSSKSEEWNQAKCPCALTAYQLSSPSGDLFRVNDTTGIVYLTDASKLKSDSVHNLTVIAFAVNHLTGKHEYSDEFHLKLFVQNQLGRTKRQAGSRRAKTPKSNSDSSGKNLENFATSFSLRTISSEVNSLQVGNSIHYRLEIALPRGSLDLSLEINTRQDSNVGDKNAPALSLYNFTIPHRISGVSYAATEPTYIVSKYAPNVFDKLTIDFGSIKNSGPERNLMTIYFSVVLTRKPGKDKDLKHSVVIGAEYGQGTFVWVAQSQITTASLSSSEDQVLSNVDIESVPSQIALDSAALFNLAANLEFRSDRLRVEVSKMPSNEYDPDNLISVGRVTVSKFGKNYKAIPNNVTHYHSHRELAVSQLSFSNSTLDMGVVTNVGERNRFFSNNPENAIHFVFPIYALNYEENVGKNATFLVCIYIGSSKPTWSRSVNVTISERKAERSIARMLSSSGRFDHYNVSKGGLTKLTIRSDFVEANGFVDFSLAVDVPTSNRAPLFVPCSGRFINQQSGMNVPYLSAESIRPTEDSNQFLFNFGRIHFLRNFPPNQMSADANVIVTEITFRVPFHDDVEDGSTVYANAKVFSGSKSMKVEIAEKELMVYWENKTGQIEFSTNRSVMWEHLIIGGGIGLNFIIDMEANAAFNQFEVLVRKDKTQMSVLPELNICRLSVIKVGSDLPCTCVNIDSINQNRTRYGVASNLTSFHNNASIDLGAISVANSQSEKIYRKLIANVAMMIADNPNDHEQYSILVDVLADKRLIWTEKINFTIGHDAELSDSIRNMEANLSLQLLEKGSITPGFTTNVLIQVSIEPNTMGPMMIEMISEDDELSVCGLWIHRIGDNMPCINKDAKANYNSVMYGQNNMAKLSFDMITNFGSAARRSAKEELRANTLEFMAMVRISETAKTNKTVKVVLTHGYKSVKLEQELLLVVNGSERPASDFRKPKHFAMRSADDTNVTFPGVSKLIYFDIELERNSQVPITIIMETSNDFRFCNSAFVKIGRNYPCYSTNSLKVTPGRFELGMICNTFLNKENFDDNLLRLAVALRVNDDLFPGRPFRISSMAYVGSTPLNDRNELQMSVGENQTASAEQLANVRGATVHADGTDNVPLKIRERKWVPFNIRIPPFTTSELTLHLQGETDDLRAIIVLHDLRIVSGGSNIPCPLENGKFKLNLNSSVGTSQNNVIESNMGSFSNFGFSHSLVKGHGGNETEKFQDDLLRMEVLVELSDHPAITEDGVYKVIITTFYGPTKNRVKRQGAIKLAPVIVGEVHLKIDANIKLKKKMEVLDRGDKFTMTATLRHLPESNAEPINPVLRLFTPDFIEVIRIESANTNELPTLSNGTAGTTDILFPWILFSDEIIVNFTIQIDPKNIRGYGREEASLVTPYRVMCEHFRAEGDFKSPCSELKHLQLISKSSECLGPLGMESGQIADWQISASSAISQDFAPTNVRLNSGKFWSPILRKGRSQYLQIDFARKTRVVRLVYRSIRGMRRVSSFHLLYSDDARVWRTAANRSQFIFSGEDGVSIIKKPAEARFYRFLIDRIDSSSKSKNQYLSVRLELFGCYLEDQPISNLNVSKFVTHFSDDATAINRHIAVDPYTNVIYFCDLTPTIPNHQLCYYSGDDGNRWFTVGRSIDSISGFELASGKFFAIDYERPAYFSSSNGLVWTPIDFEEYNITVNHPKFQSKAIVPFVNMNDMRKMDIRAGRWKVSFDGLRFDDSVKALWNECCGQD